ncbi:MAG: PAS domain-containing protein [Candidatus Eremiobacteraeota bacterium]|nr:PAS domain-containing protein [Candidatus Eremiobacteraeota bacterium]
MGIHEYSINSIKKMSPGELKKRFGDIPPEYLLLPVGFAIFGSDDKGMLCLEGVNIEAEKITGFNVPENLGKTFEELIPDSLRLGLLDTILGSFHEKTVRESRGFISFTKTGERKAYKIKAFPLSDRSLGILFYDISREVNLQVKIEDLEKELEQALITRGEILDAIPMGICILRPLSSTKFTIVSLNNEAERLLGFQEEKVLGENFDVIWPGSYKQGLGEIIHQVAITGITYEIESLHYVNNDGQRYFHLRVFPIEGNLVGIVFQDTTRKVRMEEELKKRNVFLETVLESANLWINLLDAEGNVTLWNKCAEEISGYTASDVVGHKKIWEWLYPEADYRDKILSKALNVIAGETLKDFKTRIKTRDGKEKTIIWYSTNLKGKDGKILGSLAIGRESETE